MSEPRTMRAVTKRLKTNWWRGKETYNVMLSCGHEEWGVRPSSKGGCPARVKCFTCARLPVEASELPGEGQKR